MLFRIHRAPALVLSLLLSSPVLVGSTAVQAETADYTLSKQYGSVLFRVLQEQYLYLVGRFDDFAGSLQFDPEDLSATRLQATVKMTSVDLADSSIVELLTSSAVWFNTSLYEEASFTTESATVTGDNTVELQGELTFVGVTQPWTLDATFLGGSDGTLGGNTVGMNARGSFKRSDFGMDQYMNVAADEVEIEVNVKFNRD